MPKKKKTIPKKKPAKQARPKFLDEVPEQLPDSVASEIASIAEQLESYRDYLEPMAEGITEIPMALTAVANAKALSTIAQYGSKEDRFIAVELLKRWFEDFRPDAASAPLSPDDAAELLMRDEDE